MKKLLLLLAVLLATTFLNAQTILFHENFDPPSGADSVTATGSPTFAINTRLHYSGTQCDSLKAPLNGVSYLTTQAFSTLGSTNVLLKFAHICKVEIFDTAKVEISVNGGPWIKLTTQYINPGNSQFLNQSYRFCAATYAVDWWASNDTIKPQQSWWRNETFDISALAANSSSVQIRFTLRGNVSNDVCHGWYLDDIKVFGGTSELLPPKITMLTPIVQDTVFNTGPFNIYAYVRDVSGIDTAYLVYQLNGGANQYIPMTWVSDSTYTGTIPSYTYNNRIDYHVVAVDNSTTHNSANGPNQWFFIKHGPNTVQIGTGTSTQNYPFYNLWGYQRSAALYLNSEINASGLVSSLEWYVATTTATSVPKKIYLKSTTSSVLTADTWANLISGATLVYNSSNSFSTVGWQLITLTAPFIYGSGNLMVLCETNYGGSGTSPSPFFQYTATPTYQHQTYSADNTPPAGNGTLSYNRPNIKIAFPPNNNTQDAGVSLIVAPTGVILAGVNSPVNVKIKNYATDSLKKATIAWKVDGVLQTPAYTWNGLLLQDMVSSNLNIGNVNVAPGTHTIKVWTELPNDSTDQAHNNDTLTGSFYACTSILNGIYTIGPSGADFPTFASAFSAMLNCGISGPVTFNVQSGTYTEQLIIPEIPGTSAVNTITFQSLTGVNTDVTLKYTTDVTNNFVIKLNGADHFRFKNMTLLSTATTAYCRVIEYTGNAVDNQFVGNKITGIVATVSSVNTALVYSASGVTSLDSLAVFNNNTFTNGSYGMYFYGASTSSLENKTTITNNTFNNQYSYGIYLYYQSASTISGNIINGHATNTSYYGIYASYCDNDIKILKNKVVIPVGTYGIYVYYCDGSPTKKGLIANNFVQIGGTTASYGIYNYYSTYQEYYYNSVNITSTSTTARAFHITATSAPIVLKNNVFANNGGGFAIYAAMTTGVTSDYNDLFTTGAVLGYWGANQANLAAWKTASSQDAHSVSASPNFISTTNLHTFNSELNALATPIAGITDDIDGDTRNLTTPDIGADEFDPIAYDLGISSVIAPVAGCGLGSAENVTIRLKNSGGNAITTADVYYLLNNGTPVHEVFNGSIAPSATYDYTFTQQADLSAIGSSYTFKFYIALTGDLNLLNDTISNYTITNGWNFYNSPYTMGFEPTDEMSLWTKLDVNNDARTWEFPYSSATYSHSGANSARFYNNSANPGNDWMFSRCFNMIAGNTYKIEYWYRAESATYPQSVDLKVGNTPTPAAMTTTLLSMPGFTNTAYQKASVTFTPSSTGTYYFGWYAYSAAANYYSFIDDINISLIPGQEAALVSVKAPVSGCGLSNAEAVTIKIKNTGSNPIQGNFTAYYKVNNGSVFSQVIPDQLLSNDTLLVTFTQTADLSVTTTDQTFNVKAWISLLNDPIAVNDTINKEVISYHTPAPPIVVNQTIPWGTSTILYAASPDSVFWYDAPTGGTQLAISHYYTTPILFTNTVYYAQAGSGSATVHTGLAASYPTATSGAGTTNFGLVFDALSAFHLKSVTVYPVSSSSASGTVTINIINAAGTVLHTATANVTGSPAGTPVPHVINLDFDILPGTNMKMQPAYTGISGLLFEPSASAPGGNYGYPYVVPGILSINTSTLTAAPTNTPRNDLYYYFYNWELGGGSGCASARVADTVFLNLFPYEASMISIPTPVSSCSNGTEHVTIRLRNNGSNTINNFLVNYKVNTAAVVTETVTTPVLPNDTLTYTFATTFNPGLSNANQDSTFLIKAYIEVAGDPAQNNDTLQKTVTLLYTPPMPVVSNDTIPYGAIATLNAISTDEVNWYDVPSGGTALATGASFTTPALYADATYYAEAMGGPLPQYVGAYDYSIGTSSTYANTTYYLFFDVLAQNGTTIQSIDVFPSTPPGAAYTITTTNSSGTELQAYSGVTTVIAGQRETVPVNFTVPYGTAYRVIFGQSGGFYRNTTGAAYPYVIPNIISINGNSFTGYPEYYYFFYNWKVGGEGCASERVPGTAHVQLFAKEASVVSMPLPVDQCTDGSENVSIRIRNNGSDTINGNLTAKYTINGSIPVSEAVTSTILPGDTLTFTFATPFLAGLTSANQDSVYHIKAYIEYAGDTYYMNDTVNKEVVLLYTPPTPTVANVSIPYGTSTILHAVATDPVTWYNVPSGGTSLYSGAYYTTPALYGTTIYYAEANTTVPGVVTQIGNGTTTSSYVPAYGLYDYSWSSSLYTAAELGFTGRIDTIAYYATNTMAGHQMNDQRIYMKHIASTVLPDVNNPNVASMTQVYQGNINWVGPGWYKIALTTPFNYDGVGNLELAWENWDGVYVTGYPVYQSHTAVANTVKYKNADNAFPVGAGTWSTSRPNTKFIHTSVGCPSARVADTVFVSAVPPCDMSAQVIYSPNSGLELTNHEVVKVRVKNFGTTPAMNVPIHYMINGGTPVNEIIPGPIASNDTLLYTFATVANLSVYGTYHIAAYTSLACDLTLVNDTAHKTVVNSAPIYCISNSTSPTSYEDIGNVTISNINNGIATPVINNPTAINGYSDFTTSVPAAQLMAGATYPISISIISATTFYNTYVKVFIDYNRDGILDPLTETAFGAQTTASPLQPVASGFITVPYTAVTNLPIRMRIVAQETSTASAVLPCGTYTWGETEDYTVIIGPQIAHDAGVTAFIQPTSPQNEGVSVPVQVTVKNFGLDPITNASNMSIVYSYNGGTPQSVIWNGGTIAPLATANVTLPNITVLPNALSLCAWTVLAGDSNTFNDQICMTLQGNPQIDAGISAFLQPGALLVDGATATVQVTLNNYGLTPLTSMDLVYKVNGVIQATQPWTGTLLPGATTNVTFTQTFIVPAASFSVCAYTSLLTDANHANDTLCMSSYGVFTSPLPYYDNFDGPTSYWSAGPMSGTTIWELGTPDYLLTNSAHSAPNAWDVNLTTAYGPSATAYLYTQNFNFSTAVNAKMKFWYNIDVETCCDGLTLQYTTDGTTWQTLGTIGDPLATNWYTTTTGGLPSWTTSAGWKQAEFKLSAFNSVPVVRFRFVFHSDGSIQYSGASVDDFSITIPYPQDAGVELFKSPIAQAPSASSKPVKIRIRNYGMDTLHSIPVSYVVNMGTPVNGTWTGTVAPGDTVSYQFPTLLVIPSGAFSLCSYTKLTADGDHLNDTLCQTVTGISTYNLPYTNDFEGPVTWATPGTLWEWGVPSAPVINAAHSPTHAWVTKLNGNYTNLATEYLYSPYFMFTGVDSAYLEFYHRYLTEATFDGGRVEYSIGGGTWTVLGTQGDANAVNWYNSLISNVPSWSGNSGAYALSKYRLSAIPAIINAVSPVQFRFKFVSDGGNANEGWAIDDFSITTPPIPNDAGVTAILLPNAATQTGSQVTVQVTIKNLGTNVLTSIPVRYLVNGGAVTAETWSGTLASGASTNYTFSSPYISPGSTYELCAFTRLTGDTYSFNDTTCASYNTTAAPHDVGVVAIVSPSDTTIYGHSDTVKVYIKNFGTSPETSIPVVFTRNSVQVGAGMWSGTLNGGDSVLYTFTTLNVSPQNNYQLCGKTMLIGDSDPVNDEACKYFYGQTGLETYDYSGFVLYQNVPNPAGNHTNIVFYVPVSDQVSFEMYDVLGKLIRAEDIDAIKGENKIELNASIMPEGMYFYSVTYKGQKQTKRMVVTK